jgi:hypothetical protein
LIKLGYLMLRFDPRILIAAALILCIAKDAGAQGPSQAQRDAIRASCRSDFIANCSGVQPGGKEALECLKLYEAKLSASCKTAINAIAPTPSGVPQTGVATTPPPPPAATTPQSPQDQLKIVRQVCTLDDFMAHCSWITPNSPELLLCLKDNVASLSAACRNAVQSLAREPPTAATAPAGGTPTTEVPPPAAPAAAPAAPRSEATRESRPLASTPAATSSQKPSAQQLGAIRAACRADFMAHCSGVQPGGPAALQCLQRNSARVTASCQTALAAIGQGAAKGSGAVAAPTPAVAPLGPMPMMRPREAIEILRLCSADQRTLCAGIPVGDGRVMSCLAEHAAALSPPCYAALNAAARR